MRQYTKKLTYIQTTLTPGQSVEVPRYARLCIEPEHPSYQDAKETFSLTRYKYPYLPLYLGGYEFDEPLEKLGLNVLRLPIREGNELAPLMLPKEILPLRDFLCEQVNYHRLHYSCNKDAFIYLTVRTCTYAQLYYQNSQTWHIDGFQGSKIARHIPEQNIIWSNKLPTEFLIQPMFCEGLNSARHDINDFFATQGQEYFKVNTLPSSLYLMNPYNIHRVQSKKFTGTRVFIRLNFSPVVIEDITNTINPMLEQRRPHMQDVRNFLGAYPIDERAASGFVWPTGAKSS